MTLPTLIEIDVDQISPNPWQPRQTMAPESLSQLAGSIGRDGLLQPVVVRPIRGDLYELIAGQRRLTAWKMLLEERDDWSPQIPAVVRQVDDRQMMIDALTENQERENIEARTEGLYRLECSPAARS